MILDQHPPQQFLRLLSYLNIGGKNNRMARIDKIDQPGNIPLLEGTKPK